MKKLTKRSLDELAKEMPILSKELQQSFIGGGTGTEKDPYTEAEFNTFLESGSWYGGYVQNLGYVAMEIAITSSGSYTPGGGTFVSAGDFLYEINANNQLSFWGKLMEIATGVLFKGTDETLDTINDFSGNASLSEYFRQNPEAQLYKMQKVYSGNCGIFVYTDSYYDEYGQLIATRTYR